MIAGTGIDIVSIKRISKSINEFGSRFIEKIMSPGEIEKLPPVNKDEYIAGRFAVKEALIKASGISLQFNRITILNDERGKPYAASIPSDKIVLTKIHISISHDSDYAVASVIIEE
jgi:holo-[acyl-carrier protein] synthase